jgi:hypothetical protein
MGVSLGLPADAIEVKLADDVNNLLFGTGTVHFHALGNTEHYLHYRNNPEWAIIYYGSQIGDAKRGKELIYREKQKTED